MGSKLIEKTAGYLEGQLLIATPFLTGGCFARSVVYVFAHDEDGAMGIVINHVFDNLKCSQVLKQLDIPTMPTVFKDSPVHFGGPVESERGFILHTHEGVKEEFLVSHQETVLRRSNEIILSSNVDILKEMAQGKGPTQSIFALGYSGWDAGQLEQEIALNNWIPVPATPELIFSHSHHSKWLEAAESFGINLQRLTPSIGHA